ARWSLRTGLRPRDNEDEPDTDEDALGVTRDPLEKHGKAARADYETWCVASQRTSETEYLVMEPLEPSPGYEVAPVRLSSRGRETNCRRPSMSSDSPVALRCRAKRLTSLPPGWRVRI